MSICYDSENTSSVRHWNHLEVSTAALVHVKRETHSTSESIGPPAFRVQSCRGDHADNVAEACVLSARDFKSTRTTVGLAGKAAAGLRPT